VPYRDQVLIFDADDTLWEFNHLFERVIDDYLEWLAHPSQSPAEIRAALLDIEAANAAEHGYGTHVFLRSLRDCFLHLNERPASDQEQAAIDALAVPLLDHHVTPLPGVRRFCDRLRTAKNECELHVYDGFGHLFTPAGIADDGVPQPDAATASDALDRADRFLRSLGLMDKK